MDLSVNDLRLLSIHKASKILGIRYETVQKLLRNGNIKAVQTTNNRYKIPIKNLVAYVNGENESSIDYGKPISLTETENQIDRLFREIN